MDSSNFLPTLSIFVDEIKLSSGTVIGTFKDTEKLWQQNIGLDKQDGK